MEITMSQKKTGTIPTLAGLIRRTSKLRRDLVSLQRRFPEDQLEPENRVFPRLISPRWRNLVGDVHGPYDRKHTEAVNWISQYGDYIRDLEGYVAGVMLRPDLFSSLPFNGQLELSADECVRRLSLQEGALKRIQAVAKEHCTSTREDLDSLRDHLIAAVETNGMKDLVAGTGLNRDTINDFIRGRSSPRKPTLYNFRSYLSRVAQWTRPVTARRGRRHQHWSQDLNDGQEGLPSSSSPGHRLLEASPVPTVGGPVAIVEEDRPTGLVDVPI
jgi:hypothetical protein